MASLTHIFDGSEQSVWNPNASLTAWKLLVAAQFGDLPRGEFLHGTTSRPRVVRQRASPRNFRKVSSVFRLELVDESEPACCKHLYWLSVCHVASIHFELRLCLNLSCRPSCEKLGLFKFVFEPFGWSIPKQSLHDSRKLLRYCPNRQIPRDDQTKSERGSSVSLLASLKQLQPYLSMCRNRWSLQQSAI